MSLIEIDDAISFGIGDMIGEDRRARTLARARSQELPSSPWPKKILSPSTRHEGPPATKSAPIVNACASPFGSGWTA